MATIALARFPARNEGVRRVQRREPRGRSSYALIAILAVSTGAAALVLLPIASLLRTALSGGTGVLAQLGATVLPDALGQTLVLLAGVALGAGAIGAGTAWLVTAYRFPGSAALSWLLPLPLAVPTYVAAFIYVELLDAAGPVQAALRAAFGWQARSDYAFPEIRSMTGCIVVLSLVLYPYVYVPVRAAFLARGHAAIDAARTLGGGGWPIFSRVALPLARPVLAAGIALALLETLNDIGATEFLGVRTLTLSAYTAWLNRGDLPAAAQIACFALLAVALLLALERQARPELKRAGWPVDLSPAQPVRLHGWRAAAAGAGCAAPVALGLLVPALFLLTEVVRRDLLSNLGPGFGGHLGASLALAGGASVLILAVALPIALATRWTPFGEGAALAWMSGLGYAIPGTFLVLGLLRPLVAVDGALGGLVQWAAGVSPGLLLTGSFGGLLVVYLIRFLRVATAPLAAQLEASGAHLESAARVLGAGPLAVARFVQLPALRPAVGAAALLVFIDCLKELPATLLLRPLNVETLATLVYGAASRGSFEDGAAAALLIIALCLGPVAWLTAATRPAANRSSRGAVPRPT